MNRDTAIELFGETVQINPVCSIDIDGFLKIFGHLSEDATADEFIEFDGGIKGYKEFFERCKKRGILD